MSDKMGKETLKALKQSIEKWNGLTNGTVIDYPSVQNCALCDVFLVKNCSGCPVEKRTGVPFCENTPYYDYCEARNFSGPQSARPSARKMCDFLETLLPEGE